MSILPRFEPSRKLISDQEVEQAWQAHAALRKAACGDPGLTDNPYFTALQDTAYARFLLAFEAL